jgi:hypothetical protein
MIRIALTLLMAAFIYATVEAPDRPQKVQDYGPEIQQLFKFGPAPCGCPRL